MKLLVIALDGPIADTLHGRSDAIAKTLHEFSMPVDMTKVASLVVGRTVNEVIRLYAPDADETTLDLMGLAASRRISQYMATGAVINTGAVQGVHRLVAGGTHVVLRADSARRDIESVLTMSGLDSIVRFVHCSDDRISPEINTREVTALERSYASIARRVGERVLRDEGTAVEMDGRSTAIAAQFVTEARVFDAWT